MSLSAAEKPVFAGSVKLKDNPESSLTRVATVKVARVGKVEILLSVLFDGDVLESNKS